MKKRMLSLLLAAAMLAAAALPLSGGSAAPLEAAAEVTQKVGNYLLGDFNCDGVVDTTDARLILQVCAHRFQDVLGEEDLYQEEIALADVNQNGGVDTTDARLVLQYASRRISDFPDPDMYEGNTFLPTDAQAGTSFASLDELDGGAPGSVTDSTRAFGYFALTTEQNEGLPFNVACCVSDTEITALLPAGVDTSAMLVSYTYYGDKVLYNGAPVSEATVFDFTAPVTLTLVARDGSTGEATVTIETLNTGLPSLAVTQEGYIGGEAVDHDIYSRMTFYLGGGDQAACSYAPGETLLVTGGIKGRGNSSWYLDDKKSFTVKLDKKATLLDMDKSKNWALVANYEDKSLLRNSIAAYFAEEAGVAYVMQARPVDLWLDGEYWGTYNLTQKIEIEGERVSITDTDKPDEATFTDPAANEVGYLLEFDAHVTEEDAGRPTAWGFDPEGYWEEKGTTYWQGLGWSRWEYPYTNANGEARTGIVYYNPNSDETFFQTRHCNGKWITIKKPSTANLQYNDGAMQKYIYQQVMLLDSVIGSGDESRIAQMVDIDSVARWAIVEDLMDNTDSSFHSSVYVSVDVGGKFVFGPVWDFDRSAGTCSYWRNSVNNLSREGGGYWSNRILSTGTGRRAMKNAWAEFKVNTADWESVLDAQEAMIYESSKLNFKRWAIMGKSIYPNPDEITNITTYKGQVAYLKQWLQSRYSQMDSYINGL